MIECCLAYVQCYISPRCIAAHYLHILFSGVIDLNKKKKKRDDIVPLYITLPISNSEYRHEPSNVGVPSDADVAAMKSWSELNEK